MNTSLRSVFISYRPTHIPSRRDGKRHIAPLETRETLGTLETPGTLETLETLETPETPGTLEDFFGANITVMGWSLQAQYGYLHRCAIFLKRSGGK